LLSTSQIGAECCWEKVRILVNVFALIGGESNVLISFMRPLVTKSDVRYPGSRAGGAVGVDDVLVDKIDRQTASAIVTSHRPVVPAGFEECEWIVGTQR
jgi:hypothetical protein